MKDCIKFKKLDSNALLPKYAHEEDAGMDVFSNEDTFLNPKEWALVKTGFCMELPRDYEAQVRSKSGLSLKSGIIVLNSPGTIDENYRGEVGVIIMNVSNTPYHIEKHQKIAQMVINKVEHLNVVEVEEISSTIRGEGGFGSTGLNKQ